MYVSQLSHFQFCLLGFILLQLISPCQAEDKQVAPQLATARPRIALALGGGGSRGAAHIGVLKVLEQEGVPIDCIAGTSIGSIIGGLYAAGVPLERIKELAGDKSIFRAYNTVPIWLRVAIVPFTMLPRIVGIHPYVGLYRGKKFATFINHVVPEERRNIENTKIPFRAVATDLLTGEPYSINSGPIGTALQASAAIPWLRKPVLLNGKLLCDGVLAANLPVQQARDLGADVVICVDIDGVITTEQPEQFRHIKFMENRTASLLMSRMDVQSVKDADLVLHPDVGDVGVLSTKQSDINKAIAAGEQSARDAMPRIRQLLEMHDMQAAKGSPKVR